ncbi:MAG: hypothetical protein EAZ76_05390 [Nostocales cyanobacterium]|nr:MAG: hypothetical protein EAZ87_13165 [Nostocales cyanobacterium]TAF18143.1 MAG: hypothetical protein EAZ76_05390 [Nostocales cyanobacterium]
MYPLIKISDVLKNVIFLSLNSVFWSVKVLYSTNLLPDERYSSRGSAYLFAPMIEFNVMAEVGDTPP